MTSDGLLRTPSMTSSRFTSCNACMESHRVSTTQPSYVTVSVGSSELPSAALTDCPLGVLRELLQVLANALDMVVHHITQETQHLHTTCTTLCHTDQQPIERGQIEEQCSMRWSEDELLLCAW